MSTYNITLGDAPLDFELLDNALEQRLNITLSKAGLERAARSRQWIANLVKDGKAIYGINTGFGHLKNKRVADNQLDELQENLLLSHAVGVGPAAPPEIVRWMLMLKTHMLLRGHSGVRPEVIERMATMLNNDLLPVVPTRGSLGASGDLAPLAHLFLPLLGRGEIAMPEGPQPTADVLAKFNLPPIQLKSKEGLALINGTQFMSAYAANIGVRATRLANLADLIMCMSLEAIGGSIRPADARVHELRPHPGAQTTAANIRQFMRESEILKSHEDCDRVQDSYSFRCVPQVHGAFRDALTHFKDVITREINSVTDNPLLFENDAISGGNFHGAPLAGVLDYLAMLLTDLGNISERRLYVLLSGEFGLPKLLMLDTGLNSGFMIPQYTAASLLNECKVLSTPACVDSIPTSLGQEDHVSMGATSALKCYEILDRVEHILAIELMCAAQAMDYRAPLKAGVGPREARDIVRETIPHAEHDRQFGVDIHQAIKLIRTNQVLRAISTKSH